MFALALYDAGDELLLLARDRLGQKPLAYALLDDRIVFASEIKALLAHPRLRPSLRPQAVPLLMCFGYIPGPNTIWQGISRLPPACFARVGASLEPPEPYWRLEPAPPPDAQSCHRILRDSLTAAVARRALADVPVGALLSGGIDSAIVTALLVRGLSDASAVRTFTATFDEPEYDEADLARLTATRLGTRHTELPVSLDPRSAVETVVDLYDEPFGDSSALALRAVCQEARRHVTVALVGDGGDEAFAGYDRHRAMWLSAGLRPGKYLLLKILASLARPFAPAGERSCLRRFLRFVDGLGYPYSQQYFRYRSLFAPEELPVLFSDAFAERIALESPVEWFGEVYEAVEAADEVQQAQYCDYATYLPDDLLIKADIASMSCGLELRAPMLDPKVVCLGLGLPAGAKVERRLGKRVLREAFRDELPEAVLRGRKRGFGVPLRAWLAGPLRGRVEGMVGDGPLARSGMFRPEALRVLAREQLAGRRDHGHRIWALLVLDEWLSRFGQ
jgi:asparagine synthase (glutamine-hydrolysing)